MFPAVRNSGRCIYCAFRVRQSTLQARRFRSSQAAKRFDPGHGFRPIPARSPRGFAPSPEDLHARRAQQSNVFHKHVLRDKPGARVGVSRGSARVEAYSDVLQRRLASLKEELKETHVIQQVLRENRQGDDQRIGSFSQIWNNFTRIVLQGDSLPWGAGDNHKFIRVDLRATYLSRGVRGLDDRIKYFFYGHVTDSRFEGSDDLNQKAIADLRHPTEWYPGTRPIQRTIHLHVGPTNSGKTYQALQRLEQADKGVYAGPLRLLAHEVYTRMNAKGKACALVTGEERRFPATELRSRDKYMSSCTVEMMPLNMKMDVAVIDEIQMIGNTERGWAWTQALLGVKAKEVHLCGEERTVPLIRELCASVGEKLEIHRYTRLSPLNLAETSLDGDLTRLRKGDCIVSFSVIGIHALRRQIERHTGKKVATVYGSLPPETRAQQARLFNDPNNDYDYLVASDAVGMGLNLAIKRMIFETSSKFDGFQRRTLEVADIKQIAGRAGRFRTAAQALHEPVSDQDLAAAKGDTPIRAVNESMDQNGIVTTLDKFDFPIIQAAMAAEPEPIRTAGLFPPSAVLERFATYFPVGTPFSYILTRLQEISQTHSRFHLCDLKDQIWIADLIEPVRGLTITDRNIICSVPASKNEDMWKTLMPTYARCVAEQKGGDILEIEELPLELLEMESSGSREYLRDLESLHKGIVAYLWLSYRFAGIFPTRPLASHIKSLAEEKIEEALGKFSFTDAARKNIAMQRQKQVLMDMQSVTLKSHGGSLLDTHGESSGDTTSTPWPEGINASGNDDEVDLDRQISLNAGDDYVDGDEHLILEESTDCGSAAEKLPDVSALAPWRQQRTRENDPVLKLDEEDLTLFDDSNDTNESVQAEGPSADHKPPDHRLPKVTSEALLQGVKSSTLHDDQISPPGPNQFGADLPAKHLAHLDTNATELERDVVSRP